MPRLDVTLSVVDSPVAAEGKVDVTLDDPEDVANEIVETFNEWALANGYHNVALVKAEWGGSYDG